MFIGEYQHTLDQKGRVNVPSKLRETLGTSFIMTKGLDGCIFVYHKDDWSSFEEKCAKIPISNAGARRFIRYFFSSTVECEPDNLGRINIPANLREHAALKKEVIIAGAYNRVEIWDKDRWNDYNNAGNCGEVFDESAIAAQMSEFGI